jgi:3-oxoacyl-[acyl-carrier protein] reductase
LANQPGGSSGIGRGTVEYLSSYGANVVSADVNLPLDPLPSGAAFYKCDVTIWTDIVQLFEATRERYGKIDIVCANAGIADKEDLLKDDKEEPRWDVLDVNLKGVMMSRSLPPLIGFEC